MNPDDIYQASLAKRRQRYEKDWEFKRIFYQKLDDILEFRYLEDLKPELEWLIAFSEQIDCVNVYQPLPGSYMQDMQCFFYGLINWQRIKQVIVNNPGIKQVDIISQAGLDKDSTGFFLYMLDKIGVIRKEKQGRYNVYWYVTEQLSKAGLINGLPNLFDVSKRSPTE